MVDLSGILRWVWACAVAAQLLIAATATAGDGPSAQPVPTTVPAAPMPAEPADAGPDTAQTLLGLAVDETHAGLERNILEQVIRLDNFEHGSCATGVQVVGRNGAKSAPVWIYGGASSNHSKLVYDVLRGGRLIGENTDGKGFLRGVRQDAGIDPNGKRCVVLGAGGAARAIVTELALAGAANVLGLQRMIFTGSVTELRAGR